MNYGSAIGAGIGVAGALLNALGSLRSSGDGEDSSEQPVSCRSAEEHDNRGRSRWSQKDWRNAAWSFGFARAGYQDCGRTGAANAAAQNEAEALRNARREDRCKQGDEADASARSEWEDEAWAAAELKFLEAEMIFDECGRQNAARTAKENAARAGRLAEEQAARENAARKEADRQRRAQECKAAYDRGLASHSRGSAALGANDFSGARVAFRAAHTEFSVCNAVDAVKTTSDNLSLVDQREAAHRKAEEERRKEIERQHREANRIAACAWARNDFITGQNQARALDAEAAIKRFDTAAKSFSVCGDSENASRARYNLDLTRKLAAALKEEAGRVGAAQASYGAASPYGGDSPFANGNSGKVPEAERAKPRLDIGNLYGEAAKICAGRAEKGTPAWSECMHVAQAQVIRKYEPEVAGHCSGAGSGEAVIDCVNNRYLNLVRGNVRIARVQPAEENLYSDRKSSTEPAKPKASELREALRRKLQQEDAQNASAGSAANNGSAVAPGGPPADELPKGTVVNSGSAVAPGVGPPRPPMTRAERESEILEGLPQFSERGNLSAPSSDVSGAKR